MAGEKDSDKKQPQLRIIDDNEPVHRLGGSKEDASPARKKTSLRRSNESDAIARDLSDKETSQRPLLSSRQQESEESPSLTPPPAAAIRIPPAFLVLVAFAFLVLLGVGIFLALGGRHREDMNSGEERSREKIQLAQEEKEDARDIVAALSEALQGYTSASTIEEKLRFVRQPERVEPLMRDYYQTHPLAPEEGAELVSQFALPIESSSFVILTAAFPDGPNRIFLAEANTELKIGIDWESEVSYQPVDITDYIAKKSTEPVDLRVFGVPDNFYVYEFSDSSKYQSLKLTFRDNDEILFGYVERDSPTSERMMRHFHATQQGGNYGPEPLYLRVKFPANAKGERGVLIEDFIAPRWANIEE